MVRGIFAFGLALVLARGALACSCMPPPPPLEARNEASAVFVGKVVSREDASDAKRTSRNVVFQFEVTECLKGDLPKSIKVSTPANSAMCGVNFSVGQNYLVYAFGEVTELATNLCTRTRPVDRDGVKEEIETLRKAK